MSTLATRVQQESQHNTTDRAIEKAIVSGDLRALTEVERLQYNFAVCRSLGLNPLLRPIDYLVDERSGKVSLYVNAAGIAQLRAIHGISVRIIGRTTDEDGLHYVTCRATDNHGREEEAIAIVSLTDKYNKILTGQAKANLMMRAETKSKRRATLALCGLPWLEGTKIRPSSAIDPPPDLLPEEDFDF
ncbi:MAG: hypothetical protein HC890_03275 [Chloroflexaceae bacterium]|nr:hypothetical protein [Chloroflexaceae bacterium]